MDNYKPERVPLSLGLQLVLDMNSLATDSHNYCKIVEKLMFLTITQLDLAYAVSLVSMYMAQP
jgi:hypothetical protein